MKQIKQDLDAIIDNAARAIRDEQIDQAVIDNSAASVWARVSGAMSDEASAPAATAQMENVNTMNIRGCDDFRALIPAYLEGKLSTARKFLLEDHSNECIPCRQELKTQRAYAANRSATYVAPSHTRRPAAKPAAAAGGRRISRVARWSVAAAAVVCIGLLGFFVTERFDWSGTTLAATVESADGSLMVVSDAEIRALASGEQVKKGERVRTAKDSNAVLKLADGSTVEMRERSEFEVTENRRGVTVHLERGDVIVEAAKQHNGRLYVETPDSIVSVKGTIFAVESGTKGSRVSVVEGEVQVDHAGKHETLNPGDQTTTKPGLEKTPVANTVAWSRNASKYANLVAELARLKREVDQRVARPGVRYSSRFVDLVPANTVFYAALPNLSQTIAESQRIMQERISQNPALSEWWQKDRGEGVGLNQETLTRVVQFGSYLGDEIVVSAAMDAKSEPKGILVMAAVNDAASLRSYINDQIAQMTNSERGVPNVRVIDDPMTETANKTTPGAKPELFVWITNDIFAASPEVDTLSALSTRINTAEGDRFTGSSFHARINDIYREGAGLVVAADLEKIVAKAVSEDKTPEADRHIEGFRQLGILNLRHFVVEQKEDQGRTLSRAALTFSEPGKGIASWLAAPGPMGALDFISPSANVVTAFVVKDPALLVDDLLAFFEVAEPDMKRQMQALERQQGFNIRNDFAAPLGGEFAFALDGPILPTPSWKIVLEVYDQAKLQDTFQRAVDKFNQFSAMHSKGQLRLESTVASGRTFYSIKSADAGLEVHYTYANGYLVGAPSRVLLEQSLANRDAGNTLVRSSRFMSALPQDGNTNFSAVLYHDLAPLMGPIADRLKNAAGEQGESIAAIDANAPPTLAYAYAQGDRITLAANTEGGAFGLSPASLIGLPNSFQMQHILMNALGNKDVQKKSE